MPQSTVPLDELRAANVRFRARNSHSIPHQPELAGREHSAAHGCVSWPRGCCEAADSAWRHHQLQDHGALPPPPSPRWRCSRRTPTYLPGALQNGWNVLHTVATSGHTKVATAIIEHNPALMHEKDFVSCRPLLPPAVLVEGPSVVDARASVRVGRHETQYAVRMDAHAHRRGLRLF